MIKYKKIKVEQQVVDDVICNQCGVSLIKYDNPEGLMACFVGGFGSSIGDGVLVEFAMCEHCLVELFKSFKIEPVIGDSNEEWPSSEG